MSRFINPKHLMGATKNSLSGLAFAEGRAGVPA